MKVGLIGASGFVGKAILNELIIRGHRVTAIVRNPDNVSPTTNVRSIQTNIFNVDDTAAAVKGHDAVISAYNAGWTNPNLYDDFLQGSKLIQEAVKQSGVKRIIVIGGAGSLYVADGVQLLDTPQFPKEYKAGATAARDYLNYLREENELEWTFLSPAIEMHQGTSGERKGSYRVGLENPVFATDNKSIISVEDIAVAVVDELEHPKHIRQRFTVAY